MMRIIQPRAIVRIFAALRVAQPRARIGAGCARVHVTTQRRARFLLGKAREIAV
jgi:hypothetical protein